MGRYNLTPHLVQRQATSLLRTHNNQHTFPPPWYTPVSANPPPQILTRPPLRRPQRAGKKSSKLFTPVQITYEEDKLRWEYFNDHPWELARPRIVLENDGRDREKWDWSVELDIALRRPRRGSRCSDTGRTTEEWDDVWRSQAARPLNGESVVQRQMWLLRHTSLSSAAAYDKARKELYRTRHALDIERRIAHEEALAFGAFFGKGPVEVGVHLEKLAYESWKAWAIKEAEVLKQSSAAAYTGEEVEDVETKATAEQLEPGDQPPVDDLQIKGVTGAIPGSKRGLEAKGGAA